MASGSDSSSFPLNGNGLLPAFNKHGLPGAVIGAQFVIIAGLIYIVVTALQANTKAMTEFTGAVHEMNKTIERISK